jgi:hypothetical protein
MVRMDSPRRGASFLYRTHVSTIHGCGTMKGLCGSCLEEEERKLNEGEGKPVYIQTLTNFGSPEPKMRVALRIRFPQGLCGGCFRQRASQLGEIPLV